ncbi:hypothetical protein Q7C36_005193 [Tachysurus vachellii]|uniref:Uncharacterized protein n=1 Tax=Tachysurus vachellii TaxID=175792 RepID=A0AA88NQJ0_TACVA|nr:hypothetical protein Q7C36_005193 [Tachysurus vachellii]
MPRRRTPGHPRVRLTTLLTDLLRLLRRPAKSLFIKFDAQVPFTCIIKQHGSLQELSPSSIGNACTKKAVGPQAASKVRCALAGNRTRASRVAGENSTTEPPMHMRFAQLNGAPVHEFRRRPRLSVGLAAVYPAIDLTPLIFFALIEL